MRRVDNRSARRGGPLGKKSTQKKKEIIALATLKAPFDGLPWKSEKSREIEDFFKKEREIDNFDFISYKAVKYDTIKTFMQNFLNDDIQPRYNLKRVTANLKMPNSDFSLKVGDVVVKTFSSVGGSQCRLFGSNQTSFYIPDEFLEELPRKKWQMQHVYWNYIVPLLRKGVDGSSCRSLTEFFEKHDPEAVTQPFCGNYVISNKRAVFCDLVESLEEHALSQGFDVLEVDESVGEPRPPPKSNAYWIFQFAADFNEFSAKSDKSVISGRSLEVIENVPKTIAAFDSAVVYLDNLKKPLVLDSTNNLFEFFWALKHLKPIRFVFQKQFQKTFEVAVSSAVDSDFFSLHETSENIFNAIVNLNLPEIVQKKPPKVAIEQTLGDETLESVEERLRSGLLKALASKFVAFANTAPITFKAKSERYVSFVRHCSHLLLKIGEPKPAMWFTRLARAVVVKNGAKTGFLKTWFIKVYKKSTNIMSLWLDEIKCMSAILLMHRYGKDISEFADVSTHVPIPEKDETVDEICARFHKSCEILLRKVEEELSFLKSLRVFEEMNLLKDSLSPEEQKVIDTAFKDFTALSSRKEEGGFDKVADVSDVPKLRAKLLHSGDFDTQSVLSPEIMQTLLANVQKTLDEFKVTSIVQSALLHTQAVFLLSKIGFHLSSRLTFGQKVNPTRVLKEDFEDFERAKELFEEAIELRGQTDSQDIANDKYFMKVDFADFLMLSKSYDDCEIELQSCLWEIENEKHTLCHSETYLKAKIHLHLAYVRFKIKNFDDAKFEFEVGKKLLSQSKFQNLNHLSQMLFNELEEELKENANKQEIKIEKLPQLILAGN